MATRPRADGWIHFESSELSTKHSIQLKIEVVRTTVPTTVCIPPNYYTYIHTFILEFIKFKYVGSGRGGTRRTVVALSVEWIYVSFECLNACGEYV